MLQRYSVELNRFLKQWYNFIYFSKEMRWISGMCVTNTHPFKMYFGVILIALMKLFKDKSLILYSLK